MDHILRGTRPAYDTTERVKQIEKDFDKENVERNLEGMAIFKFKWLRDYPERALTAHPEFNEIVKTDRLLHDYGMNGDTNRNKFLQEIYPRNRNDVLKLGLERNMIEPSV
jgi:hypothetical protein